MNDIQVYSSRHVTSEETNPYLMSDILVATYIKWSGKINAGVGIFFYSKRRKWWRWWWFEWYPLILPTLDTLVDKLPCQTSNSRYPELPSDLGQGLLDPVVENAHVLLVWLVDGL